jgi:hypothetical protein
VRVFRKKSRFHNYFNQKRIPLLGLKLHSEETEIQILLADLQTDVQIYLAMSIGFLAGLVAIVAIAVQIYLAHFTSDYSFLFVLLVFALITECFSFYGCIHFGKKAKVARDEIKKLRAK